LFLRLSPIVFSLLAWVGLFELHLLFFLLDFFLASPSSHPDLFSISGDIVYGPSSHDFINSLFSPFFIEGDGSKVTSSAPKMSSLFRVPSNSINLGFLDILYFPYWSVSEFSDPPATHPDIYNKVPRSFIVADFHSCYNLPASYNLPSKYSSLSPNELIPINDIQARFSTTGRIPLGLDCSSNAFYSSSLYSPDAYLAQKVADGAAHFTT
jgi:hypothetical protein